MKIRIGKQFCSARRQTPDVPYGFQTAIYTIRNEFGNAAHPGADRHHATSHGFKRRQSERFHLARHQQNMCLANQALYMILLTGEIDVIRHAQLKCETLGRATFRTIAHHQQFRVYRLADFRKNTNAVQNPFHRPKVRQVNEQWFRAASTGIRGVGFAIDEVMNDPNLILNSESFNRVDAKIVADRRNPVRLLD